MNNDIQTTKHKLNPGYFFLSIGVLASLVTSVTVFLNLAFETLNFKFPDALNAVYQYGYNSYNYEGARGAIATLIIFFPVFLALSYFWNRANRGELGSTDAIIKKWMMYLVLFIAALVIVIDLVYLVRYFVSGEITTRFVLKVATAFGTALIAGSYYIFVLLPERMKTYIPWLYGIGSGVIIITMIIWSFSVIGTPSMQRAWRLDERRVQDLQSIQGQVVNYWQQKEKLPVSLAEMANPLSGYSLSVDPEFEQGKKYEYAVKGPLSFEICADFSADMPKGWNENTGTGKYPVPMMAYPARDTSVSYPYPGPGGMNESWDHKIGRTCFTRTIDKDIYPPYPKLLK